MKKSLKNLFMRVCVFLSMTFFISASFFSGKPFSAPVTVNADECLYWGVDVSKHNGDLDFAKMKAAGVEFAIVRAGYGKNNIDPKFVRNMNGFLSQGIYVGAYWFLYSLNTADAVKEADYFDAALRNNGYWGKLKFPVFCDFEYDSENYMTKNGVTPSKALNTAIVKAFCDRMESHGWFTANYANQDYMKNHFNQSELAGYALWFAKYAYADERANDTPSTGNHTCLGYTAQMWQYSSSGAINGSSPRTDLNYCYVDYPSIIVKNGLNGFAAAEKDSLETDKTEYDFDDPINVRAVSAKSDAWVGIFPEEETDGSRYLRWYYVKDKDGYCDIKTATVGSNVSDTDFKAGKYKVVLFPDGGSDLSGKLTKIIRVKEKDMLATDRTVYYPDDPIKVTATSDGQNAWVGIFPEEETDGSRYLRWYYVKDHDGYFDIRTATAGTNVSDTEFKAGKYKVVLFPDNGSDLSGKLTRVISLKEKDSVVTDRTIYYPGDPVKVRATSDKPNAWVGIYPEDETDGKKYIRWFYVRDNEGYVDMRTASLGPNVTDTELKPGVYRVVLFPDYGTDLNGRLYTTVTLKGTDSLTTDKDIYAFNAPIRVMAKSDNQNAWVGIFPEEETDGKKYIRWFYVKDNEGYVNIKTASLGPNVTDNGFAAGRYKIVLFPDFQTYMSGRLSKIITIREKAAEGVKPVITLAGGLPASVKAGEKIVIPKATAHDSLGRDVKVTRQIRFNGMQLMYVGDSFTPDKSGEFEIVWNAVDGSNNAADPVRKVVIVKDGEKEPDDSGCGGSVSILLLPGMLAFLGSVLMILRKRGN